MQSIHSNVTQCSTSLLLVINLLIIVCLPDRGCFCGVCDINIDLSILVRFTCPMYTPRTGPSPPHTHLLCRLTMSENIQIQEFSHRHLASHPTQSEQDSDAPYHRPVIILNHSYNGAYFIC
jgi:hypothetical protein